ncbi:MAG: DNA repair protein RadA [bacterium]
MAKEKIIYYCQECGYKSYKWLGKCPCCEKWNTFSEEKEILSDEKNKRPVFKSIKPILLNEISSEKVNRFFTQISEFDRVLGGGIVPGSFVMVGGEPGIGKSTLLLQIASYFSNTYGKVLYVSGEESIQQIKLRSERLEIPSQELYLVSETNLKIIEEYIKELNPQLVIIDSIQTIFLPENSSSFGSVSQTRESAAYLMNLAKGLNIPIFIIGHVTKEGIIAGPRIIEHLVDTVLYFEGERFQTFRILRAVKNRFGSTNEIGVFKMEVNGLKEVIDLSQVFLSDKIFSSGSVVVCTIEGTRPVLVELQALVTPTNFGIPRRMALGADYNRLCLLLAVLEKKTKYIIQQMDIYINVAGGIKIIEPGIDLGIIMAVVSNFRNTVIDNKVVFIGEVGLGGEIRAVTQIEKRIIEAEKMGFLECIIPEKNLKDLKKFKIKIKGVQKLEEVIDYLDL